LGKKPTLGGFIGLRYFVSDFCGKKPMGIFLDMKPGCAGTLLYTVFRVKPGGNPALLLKREG